MLAEHILSRARGHSLSELSKMRDENVPCSTSAQRPKPGELTFREVSSMWSHLKMEIVTLH